MSATNTERKVDHAAAEMLEEPFIRVPFLPLSFCSRDSHSFLVAIWSPDPI